VTPVRLLSWIITIPVALVAISFAVSNMQTVTLSLWPITLQLTAPLYLVGLLMLLVGFLAGGVVVWFSQHRHRAARRRENRRATELQAEVTALKGQLADTERKLAEATRKPAVSAIAQGEVPLRIGSGR
jgi:uncharacterized integral membrane protein